MPAGRRSLDFAHGCAVIESRAEPHLVHSESHYHVSSEASLFTDFLPLPSSPAEVTVELLPGKGQCHLALAPAPGERREAAWFLLITQQ